MQPMPPDLLRKLARKAGAKTELVASALAAQAFLVSYPKSGRTWLRFMLSNYLDDVYRLGVGPDLHSMFRVVPNYDTSAGRGVRAFVGRGGGCDVPLVLCSHLPYGRTRFLARPVVFLVRDPRDVMVSAYFHQVHHKHRFSGDLSRFLEDARYGLPALADYLNGWAAGLRGRRHIVVSYERLSADPAGALADVAAFLALPGTPDAVARAVEASRFEAMQRLEIAEGIPEHDYDRSDPDSLRMRKGAVGGHAAAMSPAEVALVGATLAARLTPAGKRLVRHAGMALD